MTSTQQELWKRFQRYYTEYPALGLAIDLSRVNFPANYFARMRRPMRQAFKAMAALEAGEIANPDEGRRVGHYWLRAPDLAPDAATRREIRKAMKAVKTFVRQVHDGEVQGQRGPFTHLLVIGIGGSALGPQFVAHALGHPVTDKMDVHFFDNTDPDGMDRVLARIITELGQTLCVVISKSGGTKETYNGMVEAEAAYARAGLSFPAHAVAVTMKDSQLDKHAETRGWLRRFPMWDWVGGRTSVTSAVGWLPAALQGLDLDALMAGACACDVVTRVPDAARNPAAQLALMWHFLGGGRGRKDMVVIPYKDRLELFSRYLQQLVMESLGKERDQRNRIVHQGLAVYGNKGSTDQHAYVQQLRDGLDNFFVTFIEVLEDRNGASLAVGPGATSGDYLSGFLLGTRAALYENGRQSITLTVRAVTPFSVGVLIALFERAVGFYASLININAYHQPGVQAGKVAADAVLDLQERVVECLAANRARPLTAAQIAARLGGPDAAETVFKICEHLAANPGRGVRKVRGASPATAAYTGDRAKYGQ